MKFQFNDNCNLEICVGSDEDGEAIFETEFFPSGQIHDVDLLDEYDETINIQFATGDICFCLPKNLITVL